MGRELHLNDELLSDYLDGRVEDDALAELERAIAADPALAARVAGMRESDTRLRRLGSEILDEPVPQRLLEVVRPAAAAETDAPAPARPAAVRRFSNRELMRLAASIVVGIAIGWTVRAEIVTEPDLLEPFVQQAVLSHAAVRADDAAEPLMGPSVLQEVSSLETPFATPVRVPELLDSSFRPVRVGSVQSSSGPGLHVAYRHEGSGDLTSLFVRQHSDEDDVAVRFVSRDGSSVLYWLDGPLAYALVGSNGEDELKTMARRIYTSEAHGGTWSQTPQAQPVDLEVE